MAPFSKRSSTSSSSSSRWSDAKLKIANGAKSVRGLASISSMRNKKSRDSVNTTDSSEHETSSSEYVEPAEPVFEGGLTEKARVSIQHEMKNKLGMKQIVATGKVRPI